MNTMVANEEQLDPWTHHCDVADIDYSKIKDGRIECRCGAYWWLASWQGGVAWRREPYPGRRRY